MKTSISDFVAASMNATLNSKEHRSLFGNQYKTASSCEKCGESSGDCNCDILDESIDDEPVTSEQGFEEPALDDLIPEESVLDSFHSPERKLERADKHEKDRVQQHDLDEEREFAGSNKGSFLDSVDDLPASTAFNVAIDSLLTASAALDSIGLDKGSATILKLASMVIEAKKEDKKKKSKKKGKFPFWLKKKEKEDKSVSKTATEILTYKKAQQADYRNQFLPTGRRNFELTPEQLAGQEQRQPGFLDYWHKSRQNGIPDNLYDEAMKLLGRDTTPDKPLQDNNLKNKLQSINEDIKSMQQTDSFSPKKAPNLNNLLLHINEVIPGKSTKNPDMFSSAIYDINKLGPTSNMEPDYLNKLVEKIREAAGGGASATAPATAPTAPATEPTAPGNKASVNAVINTTEGFNSKAVQQALYNYYKNSKPDILGSTGPAKNGVDGNWRNKSENALKQFMQDSSIPQGTPTKKVKELLIKTQGQISGQAGANINELLSQKNNTQWI